jgi:hypothetical protein
MNAGKRCNRKEYCLPKKEKDEIKRLSREKELEWIKHIINNVLKGK